MIKEGAEKKAVQVKINAATIYANACVCVFVFTM